jgi:hypothetical protein
MQQSRSSPQITADQPVQDMNSDKRETQARLLLLGQLLRVAHQAAGVDEQEVAVAPEATRVQPAVQDPWQRQGAMQ